MATRKKTAPTKRSIRIQNPFTGEDVTDTIITQNRRPVIVGDSTNIHSRDRRDGDAPERASYQDERECSPAGQCQTEALHPRLRRSGQYAPVEPRATRSYFKIAYRPKDTESTPLAIQQETKEERLPEENINLCCSICFEEFRWPKSLSCGHTFCVPCIENMVDRSGLMPTLKCPTCRGDVTFPESGETEDLATNYSLLSIINDKQQSRQAAGEDGRTQNRCEVHNLVNKLYCQSCKVPVCVNCTLNEHEVGKHVIITKKEFVKDQRERVNKLSEKLPAIKATYTEIETKFKQRREQYRQDTSELEERVRAALEEKQNQLAANAAALLEEIKQLSKEPEERNQEFSVQLARQEELLADVQEATSDLIGELNARNFADETKISQISDNLVTITHNMGKLDYDFQLLPSNPRLHFVPSAQQEKVGQLHNSAEEQLDVSDESDFGLFD